MQLHLKNPCFSRSSSGKEYPFFIIHEERAFALFADIASKVAIEEELKLSLTDCILKTLEERLLALVNTNYSSAHIKQALLSANVELLKYIKPPLKVALSALIIIKNKDSYFIGGIGDFRVYTQNEDHLEILFKDPLNQEKKQSDISCYDSLKNALGTYQKPYFHVKQVTRPHLSNLIVASKAIYNSYPRERLKDLTPLELQNTPLHDENQLYCFFECSTPTSKWEPVAKNKKKALISGCAIAALFLAYLASETLPTKPSPSHSKNRTSFTYIPNKNEKILVDNEMKKELPDQDPVESNLSFLLQEKESLILQHLDEISHLKSELSKQSTLIQNLQKEIVTLKPPEKPAPIKRIHVVVQGDSLSSISQRYYGTSKRWEDIYEANKEALANKNQIKAGMHLVIPPLSQSSG